MKCYREGCHHETHHRCHECGEPVCQDHRKIIGIFSDSWTLGSVGFGPLPASGQYAEMVCDRCAYTLQERLFLITETGLSPHLSETAG